MRGQEHVISFWDELTSTEKEMLSRQITSIDFLKLQKMYENSKRETVVDLSQIEPIPYIKKEEVDNVYYTKIGEEIIKKGEVAVITMAGGQRNKASDSMDQKEYLS